jgi:hypothetical protein
MVCSGGIMRFRILTAASMKMTATSETSVLLNKPVQHYIPEGSHRNGGILFERQSWVLIQTWNCHDLLQNQ